MPKARLIEVAEAVVERITKRLDDPASATVTREYVVEIDVATLAGRKVYVLPGGVENQGAASRSDDSDDYKVGVVVVERHDGQRSGLNDWADERLLWVQTQIWERLQDVRQGLLFDCMWPQLSNWLAYDYDLLREKKLFWSEVEVTFREDD